MERSWVRAGGARAGRLRRKSYLGQRKTCNSPPTGWCGWLGEGGDVGEETARIINARVCWGMDGWESGALKVIRIFRVRLFAEIRLGGPSEKFQDFNQGGG